MTKRNEERDEEFENATAFTITKPVELGALTEEVREAQGWTARKQFGLVAEGDLENASVEEPATVWIVVDSGDKPDTAAFKKAVTKHDPTALVDELADLRAKASTDEEFTPDEIQLALRHLLRGSKGL